MFTGIIQSISLDSSFEYKEFGATLTLSVAKDFNDNLKVGDSVAVNGVCLTVTSFTDNSICFDIIHESLN